jgi:gamma-glutamyltranspeptidase/glutathione hydrolase
MNFDNNVQYPIARSPLVAKNGMVATSQNLAAAAGMEILKRGGNAIDAAIATAACLTVVEPTSNGIGSDAFAIIWCNDKIYGLNSSGAAPRSLSIEAVENAGYKKMPNFGLMPITIPGAPAAWAALSERFGKLSLAECLKPAIDYADNGYPVSHALGVLWRRAYDVYKKNLHGEEFAPWFSTFAPNNHAPETGQMVYLPHHAQTLREIGKTWAKSFYNGALADEITKFCARHGGYITKEDLQDFKPEWVSPISVDYRGFDVWEIPPNGQGIVALMALSIMREYECEDKDDVQTYHRQFEAMKLAFSAGKKHVTDPRHMTISPEEMLSDGFISKMREKITDVAAQPEIKSPNSGGTVYLATADGEGNMVSFIQSNYMGFGSGVVIEGTGIAMQNRGLDFSLNPNHVNHLAGGKKTYHTIIPGFLTKDGSAIGPFGVMGGYMQPQGHLQVITNSVDYHLNPQSALDAPRWQWITGKTFEVESHFPKDILKELENRGHNIVIPEGLSNFGRGQIIWRDNESGVLTGGCESRADSVVACY